MDPNDIPAFVQILFVAILLGLVIVLFLGIIRLIRWAIGK